MAKILDSLYPKKETGPDKIPSKRINMAGPAISDTIAGMINNAIDKGTFPDALKKADVTPVFKKADQLSKENYCKHFALPI